MDDEGVLDPWVADWVAANPQRATPFEDLSPEILELARGPVGFPPTRDIADIRDDEVDGVPVRIYRHEGAPTGLVVYFHGGGFVIGSIGLMDNVARELAHAAGAVVVSVGYRLAPEHPYPGGARRLRGGDALGPGQLDRFGVSPGVGGGGRRERRREPGRRGRAAAAGRRRASSLAGQVLIYPAVAGSVPFPSTDDFDGLVLTGPPRRTFWAAYTAGRDLDDDPAPRPCARRPGRASRPPWWCWAAATCSATRAGPTPPAWARTASRWRRSATPGSPTGS